MQPPDFESLRILGNNTPLDDFCDLTPAEMHDLLYDTLGDKSPLQIRTNIADEVLDKIPFLRLTEEYLNIIEREEQVKLTPSGALPRKVLLELYGHHFMPEYAIDSGIVKLLRMQDSVSIESLFINTSATRLTKIRAGKLSLTKEGSTFLQRAARNRLLQRVLQTFTGKFNWGYNDLYGPHPVGQLGWGFTVYLLFQFGDRPQTMQFYADRYLRAFPIIINYFDQPVINTPRELFTSYYSVRTFDRFLEWFGFVSVEPGKPGPDRGNVRLTKTEILTKIFRTA